jgi:hypothetical protein
LALQGLSSSSPRQNGSVVVNARRTISSEVSDGKRAAERDPFALGNPRNACGDRFIELKSTKLRCTKINAPKLMMQPAANGCAKTCHRGLMDDQPQAATDSSGSVPIQKATIIAIVMAALGAAAAANTNR